MFASSSLPLSADNSGAFSDQVYMGVFRPDGSGLPKWWVLKQYKFAVNSNKQLFLVDASGVAAASTKGFAIPDAESFWTSKNTASAPDGAATPATSTTTGSTGGFYFFDAKGSGLSYDLPDGEWVEKGGAAQQLRLAYLGYGAGTPTRGGIGDNNDSAVNSIAGRQVYTCIGGCLSTTTALAPSANRATTWFEVGNTAIDTVALGLTTTFTVSSLTNTSQSVSKLATGPSITTIAVANGNNKVATVTTAVVHGFSVGDSVTISGSSNATFNTAVTIVGVTATTFTFGSFNGPLSATGGSAFKNTSTKAFVTTPVPHTLSTGQKVVIAGAIETGFNTASTAVAITVLDASNFTYTLAAAQSGVATGPITNTPPVATATASGHGFISGASITIAGATPSTYNGTFTIKNVTTNTFDYNFSGADPETR